MSHVRSPSSVRWLHIGLTLLLLIPAMAFAQAGRDRPGEAPSYGAGGDLPPALKQMIEAMPAAGRFRFEDIVRYSVHRGRIDAEFTFPPALERQVQSQAEQSSGVRISIDDSPCIWTIQRTLPDNASPTDRRGVPRAGTDLTCYDPKAPTTLLQSTSLRIASGHATFRASDFALPGGRGRSNLLISQNNIDVVLFWRLPPKAGFRQRVESLAAMETQYPQEWTTYFMPVARQLGLGHMLHRHAAADVYRCFDQIPPDPGLARRAAERVDQIDSPDFAQRQAANKALLDLGRPGVLALLRMDRADLSPEQTAGVDAVISADGWRPAPDPVAARKDLLFLLDCLDDDDPAVRSAAKQSVSDRIGVPLRFDLSQPPLARLLATDALCAQAQDAAHFAEAMKKQSQ